MFAIFLSNHHKHGWHVSEVVPFYFSNGRLLELQSRLLGARLLRIGVRRIFFVVEYLPWMSEKEFLRRRAAGERQKGPALGGKREISSRKELLGGKTCVRCPFPALKDHPRS